MTILDREWEAAKTAAHPSANIRELDISQCLATLEVLLADREQLAKLTEAERVQLLTLAGRLSRPSKDEIRARNRVAQSLKRKKVSSMDRSARETTGIRLARRSAVFQAPERVSRLGPGAQGPDSVSFGLENELKCARNCYVCKAEYTRLHFFYDSMCTPCADFNYNKRFQTAPLFGKVALITGARLKIGYHSALMMLRAGAMVIVTTRFPVDAALRFAKESDFENWQNRLRIHGLDLRHTPSVELFCRYIEQTMDRLDILINNAAQTVRRPPGFYKHLLENEERPFAELPDGARKVLQAHEECKQRLIKSSELSHGSPTFDNAALVTWDGRERTPGLGIRASAQLSQIPYSYDHGLSAPEVFPSGKLDADLQQIDLRQTNSWRLRLTEVPAPEMVEVQLVNAVAPFILCSQLAPIMRKDFTGQKHIVNVTAMEGKFYRFTKTDRHPHTNMAKAALNMLTHTSANDLAKDGIFMNAVDTGWVTDEDPANLARLKQEVHDFQPPLDIVDGAARVCDPFFSGINSGEHWCGKFLKDYQPTEW